MKGIHHHTNQNEPPSGKYRNALQYISPNCHYILSHISQSTLNCSLEETADLVTMATTTWTSHINHRIMDILLCHVCKGIHHHTNQNEPPSGKYRNDLQYISPNCHYIPSHISQSHVSPKTILIPLGEKDPNNIWKKINPN